MNESVLDKIVAGKKEELEASKRLRPLKELRRLIEPQKRPLDFASALQGSKIKLIAEVKKSSPSRGVIRHDLDPAALARIYAESGASVISVLTEERHFQGSLDNLVIVKEAVKRNPVPILRKDFIFDSYQVFESRAFGADAILLIAAILKEDELRQLLSLSHEIGMKCLVEVHSEEEAEQALKSNAKIIGINNRNLNDFSVDLGTTERLRKIIPKNRIVISESGIKSHADVERLQKCGVSAILVGEALVASDDIAGKIKEFL